MKNRECVVMDCFFFLEWGRRGGEVTAGLAEREGVAASPRGIGGEWEER